MNIDLTIKNEIFSRNVIGRGFSRFYDEKFMKLINYICAFSYYNPQQSRRQYYEDDANCNVIITDFSHADKFFCTINAAKRGRLDVLEFGYRNYCEWSIQVSEKSVIGGIDCLKFIYKNKYPWNKFTSIAAIKHNKLDCLESAYNNGCSMDETCDYAAMYGRLECLKFLHKHGCKWNDQTSKIAVMNGNLDCLKYLCENGCPLTEYACFFAAKIDRLDILKYVHKNGCKLTEKALLQAAKSGSLDCIKYMHDNGIPLLYQMYEIAAKHGQS
jgi:hypothetical protein